MLDASGQLPSPPPRRRLVAALCSVLLAASATAGPFELRPSPAPRQPRYELEAAETWRLDAPGGRRFDASALLFLPDGRLLTVNDQDGTVARIQFSPGRKRAKLVDDTGLFAPAEMARVCASAPGRVDGEGLAIDAQGRVYLSEESRRWIFRCDPRDGRVERLAIDWTPVARWFSTDRNASFEGVAVGGDRLYVANERSVGRIIVVDLASLKIVDNFQAAPFGVIAHDIHYSDLAFREGRLWVLCRESRCVLAVNPATHATEAEFDYGRIELAPENAYLNPFPYGFVEGLAVDADNLWLAVDNNGFGRLRAPRDTRPSLWRCPRPDRPPPAGAGVQGKAE